MEKEVLLGKTAAELRTFCLQSGLPGYAAQQIAEWLYKKKVSSFEQMSNLSKAHRLWLSENCETGISAPVECVVSEDGTKKYLYKYQTNKGEDCFIESVFIQDGDRATLCISSQSGCRMACKFCATGAQGFRKQLSAWEILNQFLALPESDLIDNIVFMGMGEPMDNLDEVLAALEVFSAKWGIGMSPRRITVSSAGLLPSLRRFIEESDCHLAISLHTPFPEQREAWMPIERKTPLLELIECLKEYDWYHQRHLSFEYTLFKGQNDSFAHAKALVRLLKDLTCKVNLIAYHPTHSKEFETVSKESMVIFRDLLTSKGLFTTIRQSKGRDIQAACGLLSTTTK